MLLVGDPTALQQFYEIGTFILLTGQIGKLSLRKAKLLHQVNTGRDNTKIHALFFLTTSRRSAIAIRLCLGWEFCHTIQQSKQVHFLSGRITKFKETSPLSWEAGCARSESPRRHSAGTSGEIWSPGEGTTAAPLSQHPLLTNLQGWIDVSPNGNCSPALTCLEIKRTQNTERERERKYQKK